MRLTQCGEPAGDDSVDFVQDDDDNEVDDGSGGFDSGSDVGPCCRVGAHVQCCLYANPVQDDSKDYGKCHSDLKVRRKRKTPNLQIKQ